MNEVLFITSVVPNSLGAGKAKRAHQWLSLLQKEYKTVEVLLVQSDPETEVPDIENSDWHLITRKRKCKISTVLAILFSASRLKYLYSLFVPGWFLVNKEHKSNLNEWFGHKEFEKIVCFRLSQAELALYLQSITKTEITELDADDIESSTWRSISGLYYKNGRYKRSIRSALIAHQYKNLEHLYIKCFNKIYLCSHKDKKNLEERFSDKEILVLPNKLNPPEQIPPSCSNKNLLFVGSLSYFPNEEAVLWFAEQVLPILRETDKDWNFSVVGYTPSEKLKYIIQQVKGVILHQNLPAIMEAYASSFIVVSPLHAGGGTKLKVIEAMLYQRPVIATYESVRGLELTQGVHYLAAETVSEFAEAILSLQRNKKQYQNMVQNAYTFANDHYCYPANSNTLLNA